MERRPFVRILAGGLLVFNLLFVACGGKEQAPPERRAPSAPQAQESAPLPEKVRIRAPDNSVLVVFRLAQEEISIPLAEKPRLLSRRRGRDGVRWIERGKGTVAFVDWDENGLAVRNGEKELVWRLRIIEDGWKAANRPKGRFPFVLRGAGNRFTLVQNEERVLGHFLFQPGRGKIKVYDGEEVLVFKSGEAPRNTAFGVLLLPGGKAEAVARYVAMAELLLPRDA